jgi:lysozyme family protein
MRGMNTATAKKKATYWERIRYDASAQSSMYVVVDQGRLIMATTSLNLARQTFAKVLQGLGIDGLVGEKVKTAVEPVETKSASVAETVSQETAS